MILRIRKPLKKRFSARKMKTRASKIWNRELRGWQPKAEPMFSIKELLDNWVYNPTFGRKGRTGAN